MGLSGSQSNQDSKEKQKLVQLTAIKQSPILNTAEQCNEWNKLLTEIKAIKAKNKKLRGDVKLWKNRTDEAAQIVEVFEEIQAKNKQLEKAILDFGKNPAGFDWAVLDRIDKLEGIVRDYYAHCGKNKQICGLNYRAEQILKN